MGVPSESLPDDLVIGKPTQVEKKLAVQFDSQKGQYMGLPTVWRELLDMPLGVSKDEVETSNWDTSIGPAKPTHRLMYLIQESNNDNNFVISAPLGNDLLFNVVLDENSATGFKGLPIEFETLITTFTKEEIRENPRAVLLSV